MTVIIKGDSVLAVAAVVPATYFEYKAMVEADGGYIVDEDDCGQAFALAAKYGITAGMAISPSWGVRLLDDNVERFYGLFDADAVNPYIALSGVATFPLAVDNGFDALHFASGNIQTYPASESFAVTTSFVGMVAFRSPTINAAIEGYWLATSLTDVTRRISITGAPSAGSSCMRVQTGTSSIARNTAYGAVKAAYSGWKVSGVYVDANFIKSIEDGAVFASTAVTAGYFAAANYRCRFGCDANNSGATNSIPIEAWFAEAWAVPDASESFAIALATRLAEKYE